MIDIFDINEEYLHSAHGDEFEEIVSQYYTLLGYSVTKTPVTNDYGADLIVATPAGNFAIQCKRQSSNVSIKAIQEVYASIRKYNANFGIVITNSGYTNSAIELAKCCGIKLIDGKEFWNMLLDLQNNRFRIEQQINFNKEYQELIETKKEYEKFKNSINQEYDNLSSLIAQNTIKTQNVMKILDDMNQLNSDISENKKQNLELSNSINEKYKKILEFKDKKIWLNIISSITFINFIILVKMVIFK